MSFGNKIATNVCFTIFVSLLTLLHLQLIFHKKIVYSKAQWDCRFGCFYLFTHEWIHEILFCVADDHQSPIVQKDPTMQYFKSKSFDERWGLCEAAYDLVL